CNCNRAGLNDGNASPCKQESEPGPKRLMEKMVLATGVWTRRGQFGIAKRTQQRDQAAGQPEPQQAPGVVSAGRHNGWKGDDTDPNHYADHQGGRMHRAKRRPRPDGGGFFPDAEWRAHQRATRWARHRSTRSSPSELI